MPSAPLVRVIARVVEAAMLRNPHLMLTHIAGDDGVGRGHFAQALQQRRCVDIGAGRVVTRTEFFAVGKAARAPGLAVAACCAQGFQTQCHIAGHCDVGSAQLGNFIGVGIQMDDARKRSELAQLAGGAVVETRAHHDQQIAFLDRHIGRTGAVHAQHAQIIRMRMRQRAQTAQGQCGRDAGGFDKPPERVHRACQCNPATAVHHRAFGAGDGGQRFGQLRVFRGWRRQHRCRHVIGQMRRIGDLHVLGQVDQDRPGASLARDAKRFAHDLRKFLHPPHQKAVLDDRHGHAEHVQFLERIGAQQGRGDLAGQAHHRYRIEHRIGDAGDQIGGARAGGGHAHADPAAGTGVPVGGEGGALFVTDQDVLEPGIHQGVVERHDGAARITEQRFHALGFQGLRQPARAIAGRAVCGGVHALRTFGVSGGGAAALRRLLIRRCGGGLLFAVEPHHLGAQLLAHFLDRVFPDRPA